MSGADIDIEVVVATPLRAISRRYRLRLPATVGDALRLARVDEAFAGVEFPAVVGIFGKPVAESRELIDGDRVELYRPLAADPKTARRSRAQRARLVRVST